MVTGMVGGRAGFHLRLFDALDHSIVKLSSVWFPKNSPVSFARSSQTMNFSHSVIVQQGSKDFKPLGWKVR